MAYESREFEYEREPQASSAHGGGPPRQHTTAGVLDAPLPQGTPHAASASLLLPILAFVSLSGLALYTLIQYFRHR